jgi:hypothetical protein
VTFGRRRVTPKSGELLTRIKIDLKRLFVSVIDHSTGPEHLLFFKERFLPKDHPEQVFDESPALEAAILEGVDSPHQPYDTSVMERIRQNARSIA